MKRVRKVASYALIGGFGLVFAGTLAGCGNANDNTNSTQEASQGAFIVIEEISPGKYKILEEFPSAQTRIVVKQLNGSEKVLTKDELDALMAQENAKIDNGTSNLTKDNATLSSGGMGLGEVILSSVAGAMIGSWIGSKLFGSPAYQNHKQGAYKNPSAYSRSVDSFNKAKASPAKGGKSGFFGGGSKSSGSGSSSFGG